MPLPTKTKPPIKLSLTKKNQRGLLLILLGVGIYWLISRLLSNYIEIKIKENDYKVLYIKHVKVNESVNNEVSKNWKDTPWAMRKQQENRNWRQQENRPAFARPFKKIDLNSADSTTLEKLPGIGPVLSARIIKYRNKLGGFHSPTQLKEVYGMSDSTYGKISTQIETANASLKKIALNVADEKTIATHPYIGWRNAKLIVRYRQAHGAYMTIEQLESVWALEKTKLDRLLPYLSFDSIASSK